MVDVEEESGESLSREEAENYSGGHSTNRAEQNSSCIEHGNI